MKFRPCIDLHEGKVKQIVGSTLSADKESLIENFISNQGSEYYASLYRRDNLCGGHVIMLGPGNEEAAIKALRAFTGGLHIGGGITAENASYYLENGASHVIVTSYVFKDGDINMGNLNQVVSEIGKSKLVLDLSCRKKDDAYYIATDRWQTLSNIQVTGKLLDELSAYCGEFLVHAIEVEGKGCGIDENLVRELSQWGEIPITYAGGVASIVDLEKVRFAGKKSIDVTIGSALDIFGGKLGYNEVLQWFDKYKYK